MSRTPEPTAALRPLLPHAAAAIGCTPMVELSRVVKHHGLTGRIVAKMEYLNPGFSKKDRIAKQIIEEALKAGALKAGQPVVELTSGNTGTGLAIVCAVLGHPFIAVMSKGNSIERVRMMQALGAEVVLVDQAPDSVAGQVSGADMKLVEEQTTLLTAERGAFRADQFHNQSNIHAHHQHTAPEMWQQTAGQITAFCDFAGTGGSFAGCAAYLKHQRPDVKCYVIEPVGAAVLAGNSATQPNHSIQGGGYSMANLPHINRQHVDGYLQVTDTQAVQCARELAKLEGIFAGYSSGANLAAALQLLSGPEKGGTVAILMCDSGLKYLSTDLWE